MRIQVALIFVGALVALTGTTRADDEGEATSGCSITADSETEIPHEILGMVMKCLSRNSFAGMNENSTDDARKEFLKDFCSTTPKIHECLVGVAHTSLTCQNERNHHIFEILRELLETTLDSLCIENGELLSNLYITQNNFTRYIFETEATRDCVQDGIFKVTLLVQSDIDASMKLYMFYQDVKITKECVSKHTDGDLLFKETVDSVLTELLAKMKCVHPDEGTTVPCSSIDGDTIVTPDICPFDLQDEDVKNMMLIDGLGGCFTRNSEAFRELGDLKERSEFRSFFENYCSHSESSMECLNIYPVYASLCIHHAKYESFKLLADAMKELLEYGCFAHGKHVADLIFVVLKEENSTSTSNLITRCFDQSKLTNFTSDLPEGYDNSLKFYRQSKVFKKCILGNPNGDDEFRFNTLIFLNTIVRNMKCVHPELGTSVLCKNIADPLTIEDTACPYTFKEMDTHRIYGVFIEMSSQCLLISPTSFNTLKNYTTIDEFDVFAKSYCKHKPLVLNCLEGVKLNSEKCQDHENHQGMLIVAEMVEVALETGCLDDGQHLQEIWFNRYTHNGSDDLSQCMRNKTHNYRALDSPPTTSLQLFKEIQGLKGCLVDHINEENTFKDNHIAYINEILSKVHCNDPDTGNKVLCETIANNE